MASNQYVTKILVVSPLGFSLFKIYFEINYNRWVSESFPYTNCCMIRGEGWEDSALINRCLNMKFITEIDFNYSVSHLTQTPGNHGNLVLLQWVLMKVISRTFQWHIPLKSVIETYSSKAISKMVHLIRKWVWNLDSAYCKTLHPSGNIDIVY